MSNLNRKALEPQPYVVVGPMTKLRDGEQTLGVVLPPEDKLEIPRALEEAGIDRIEAGFPRVSDDDYAARAADRPGTSAPRCGFSRAVRADVEALVELSVRDRERDLKRQATPRARDTRRGPMTAHRA